MIAELRKLSAAHPFVPFAIHCADGIELVVPTGDHVAIPPTGRRVFVFGDDDDYQILSPLLITRLTVIENLSELCYEPELRCDQPGLLQGHVGAVLVQGLHAARGDTDPDEFLEFRDPNAAFVQVGAENARYILGHVTSDATFFLRHTTTVNDATACDL